MKKLFSMILGLVCAAGLVFAVSGCDKEDGEATNTMTLRGETYEIVQSVCFTAGDMVHVDATTKNGVLHGFGEMPASWVGKTTNLKGEFFQSFNPQEGSSYELDIKSGTIKVSKTEKGLHIIVDAVETVGKKEYAFKMNYLSEEENY